MWINSHRWVSSCVYLTPWQKLSLSHPFLCAESAADCPYWHLRTWKTTCRLLAGQYDWTCYALQDCCTTSWYGIRAAACLFQGSLVSPKHLHPEVHWGWKKVSLSILQKNRKGNMLSSKTLTNRKDYSLCWKGSLFGVFTLCYDILKEHITSTLKKTDSDSGGC